MLLDILAALARKDYEHSRSIVPSLVCAILPGTARPQPRHLLRGGGAFLCPPDPQRGRPGLCSLLNCRDHGEECIITLREQHGLIA